MQIKRSFFRLQEVLKKGDEHPLAEAIVNYCLTNNISLEKVTDFNALFGKGIEGTMSGTHYYAGNEKMMEEERDQPFHRTEKPDPGTCQTGQDTTSFLQMKNSSLELWQLQMW